MSGLLSMLSGEGRSTDIQLTEVDARPGRDDNGDLTPAEIAKFIVKLQSIIRGIRARRDLPQGFGKWTVESGPHEQARSENNPHYRGKRFPVKDDQVSWSVTWEEYKPESFTSQGVLDNGRDQPKGMKWADPPDPKLSYAPHMEKRLSFENGGVILFDTDGYPLNPRGRTGLLGRGLLGAWGPNHAADPIVTRREPLTGTIQVLAIKRNDTGEWALPGGMVKPGESVSATVKKSFNEVGNFKDPAKQEKFDELVKVLFAKGVDVFAGYVDDPRNTDNAWMESKVMHFHCSPELGELLPLNIKKSRGKKDMKGQVGWIDCSKSQEPRYANMYGSHMAWVECIKRPMVQDEDNVAHGIQMEGMEEHESAFATHKGATDVELAKKYSMAQRCVALGKDGKLDAINSKGEAIKVDTYPFRTGEIKDLDKYHCGLAVQLYFYFHVDAFFLFLILFLVSLYAWVENHSRNALRNDCRDFVETWTKNRGTDGTGASVGHDTLSSWLQHIDGEDKCGYSALDYALPEHVEHIPWFMLFGAGTCDELTSHERLDDGLSLAPRAVRVGNVSVYEYVRADSELCSGVFFSRAKVVTFWLEFAIVLILLSFFVRQFYSTRRRAEEYDAEHLTTSDFSVMVSGLEREVDVDDSDDGSPGLESKLLGDLERMGYKREDIYKVEVARFCKEPIRAMAQLASLRTQRQELQSSRAQSSRSTKDDTQPSGRLSPGKASPASQPTDLDGASVSAFAKTKADVSGRVVAVADAAVAVADAAGNSQVGQMAKINSDKVTEAWSASMGKMQAGVGGLSEKWQEQVEASLQEQIHTTENLLSAMVKTKDKSTGHAFITFNTEAMRNDFMKRLRVPTKVQRLIFEITLRLSSFRRKRLFAIGARVRHPSHGEGVIDKLTAGGKKSVLFDSGAVHAYADDSLDKLTPLSKDASSVHEKRLGLDKIAIAARDFVFTARRRKKIVFHSAPHQDLRNVKVEVAPDPSDIFWENLEISKDARRRWTVTSDLILAFLVIVSAMLLITTTYWSGALKLQLNDKFEDEDPNFVERNVLRLRIACLGLANSVVTLISNEALTFIVNKLSRQAGPTSQTGFQRSIFSMLSFLYVINTSMTPFVVASLESFTSRHATVGTMSVLTPSKDGDDRLIYQLWYDQGSIVQQMVINLVVTCLSTCMSQVVSMPSLLKRFVLARTATSQHKLNQLWMPPPMKVGQRQAKLYKAMSLVLIYAPMYPPMYLLAALYLVPSFLATRFGISHWFAQPSRMDQTVSESMRGWLAGSMGISLMIKRLMTVESIYQRGFASIPLYMSVIAWASYMVIYEGFAKTLSNEGNLDSQEATGVEFKDLNKVEYVCPKLHRGAANGGKPSRSSPQQV